MGMFSSAMWLAGVALTVVLWAQPGAVGAAEPYPEVPAEDSWAFEPEADPFTDAAVLDLRSLNEAHAGEHGFIRLSEDGMGFVRGDGEPIRFWSIIMTIGSHNIAEMTDEQADTMYRFYAKRGVNMVRLFTGFHRPEEGADIMDVDERSLEVFFRHLAAARANGLYVTVNPYWGIFQVPESWGLEGVAGKAPFGLLFFNPRLQAAYKHWLREAYTRVNPYTGLAVKDDPAVAILQTQNEDSLFFWTLGAVPEPQKRMLEQRYAEWLIEKYGSLEQALSAWKGFFVEADDVEAGVVTLVGGPAMVWEMTQPQQGGKAVRIRDQVEFLARLQRDFYAEMVRYQRQDLGCQSLTNASNWRTADTARLGDLERWTYAAADVSAMNDYTGGIHKGPNEGWRIDPGDHIVSRSITQYPLNLPTNRKQVLGMPMIVTETKWVFPNLYQTEGAFLGAAYMSVTGVDSLYYTHMDGPEWIQEFRFPYEQLGDQYGLGKWAGNTPQEVGSFPANALLYRLGYLQQAQPAVIERRSLDTLLDRAVPAIVEGDTYDPNRDNIDRRNWSGQGSGSVSRLAYLVGPVIVEYGAEQDSLEVADLPAYIDTQNKIVRSGTGEVVTDFGAGLCTMDAPKAQGVAGFLQAAGGRFALGDVTIESSNDYAVIQVVAMDDRPIAESVKLLVQVGTVARPTGWAVRDVTFEHDGQQVQGQEVVTTGQPPYRIANTHAAVTVRNPHLRKATLLDAGGYAVRELPIQRTDGALNVPLPENAMYVVLE